VRAGIVQIENAIGIGFAQRGLHIGENWRVGIQTVFFSAFLGGFVLRSTSRQIRGREIEWRAAPGVGDAAATDLQRANCCGIMRV
jgi:hypothetical protein